MPVSDAASTAALILAAGPSRRLGRPKQLLRYHGEPLLRRTVRLALALKRGPVFVTLDPAHHLPPSVLSGLPVGLIPNPEASEGMASSLRFGVEVIGVFYPHVARLLILVCDQPLLRPEHLDMLLACPVPAAAEYSGRLGVPAVFGRSHFPALAALRGDQGARSLLQTLAMTAVPLPEAALDIDSPEDFDALRNHKL